MRMNVALVSVALVAALGIGTAVAGVGGGGGGTGGTFDGNLTGNLDVSGTVKAGTGDAFTVAADGAIVGKSLDLTTALPDAEVADALTISGGTIDNSVIGGTTKAAGSFTTLTATGNTTLGDANTDTTSVLGPVSNSNAGTPTGGTVAGAVAVVDAAGLEIASGPLSITGVTVDVTTTGNEDLLLGPAGTGSVVLRSGDSTVDIQDSTGTTRGTIVTSASGTNPLFIRSASAFGAMLINSEGGYVGRQSTASATVTAGCFSESINSGKTDLFCSYGDGRSAPMVTQTATCASTGNASVAALTFDSTSDYVEVVNNDPDGCAITLSETSAIGRATTTFVVVTNAGGVVTFPDSGGAHNGPTCATTTGLTVDDTYRVVYSVTGALYVGAGCSDN